MDSATLKYLLMVAWDQGFRYAKEHPDCTDAREIVDYKFSEIELIMDEVKS
jgi:hypothetical protein